VTQHGIVRFEFGIMLITFIIQLTTPKSKTVVCITAVYRQLNWKFLISFESGFCEHIPVFEQAAMSTSTPTRGILDWLFGPLFCIHFFNMGLVLPR
jgi:hypothetical protein